MPGEDSASDRTEEATPRRREQERERGHVAKSRDLGAALILLVAAVLLRLGGGVVAGILVRFTENMLCANGEMATLPPPTGQEILPLALGWLLDLALAGAPLLLAIFLAAALANYGQVGFLFASKALEPNFGKLNPVSGLQRMFSLRSFVTLVMNLGKITLLAAVAWPDIARVIGDVPGLMDADPQGLFAHLVDVVTWMAIKLAVILLALGVADYAYQRYQTSQDMKMTKQQVKEEYKDTEGNPEVRQRRRQLQRQMAQKRMMQEVPKADVVIRNPTHYAVALGYDPEKLDAPRVLAKGKDRKALRILEAAREAGVMEWHDPPLARQLHDQVEVGQPIPIELYQVVADILGVVYRRKGKALGAGPAAAAPGGPSGQEAPGGGRTGGPDGGWGGRAQAAPAGQAW